MHTPHTFTQSFLALHIFPSNTKKLHDQDVYFIFYIKKQTCVSVFYVKKNNLPIKESILTELSEEDEELVSIKKLNKIIHCTRIKKTEICVLLKVTIAQVVMA